jgi:hypothetical protein
LSTFTLIVSVIIKLIQFLLKKSKPFENKALEHSARIGFLFFIFIIANSVIQTSLSQTVLNFEKSFMHFTVLFIIPFLLRDKERNKALLYMFFTGTLIALVFAFSYALVNKITFDRATFIHLFDIHHTYFSMYLLAIVNFSIIRIMYNRKNENHLRTAFLIALVAISLGVIYILDSKVSMIIFLMLLILHAFPTFSKKSSPFYMISFVIVLYVLFTFSNKASVNYKKALDFRLQIWEVSFNVFENNALFGNLKSPEKDILNYNHYLNGKYHYLDSDLNSHNQYLSVLMRFGVVGFLILMFYGINIFKNINNRTSKLEMREFLGFAAIVLTISYIENILDRHHGMVCVVFLYNYYLVCIENAEV